MYRPVVVAMMLTAIVVRADGSEYSERPRLPDDERGNAQAAVDALRAGKYDDAAANYRAILAKYPDSLYAWSNLGVVRSQEGHFEEAKEAFDHALKLQPRDTFCLVNCGIVYLKMNRDEGARDKFERAVQIDPENALAHDGLGQLDQKQGRPKEAAEEFALADKMRKDGFFRPPVDLMFPPIDERQDGRG
jgi:Tfp pilus assembly protein PilF